jgi:uncharacterized protein
MQNPYLEVPLIVWAVAQFIKFIVAAARGDISVKYLYGSGGMPSVHSAVVTSLAVTALLVAGFSSFEFGITAVFAAIVMYDSFGVRRSTGEQAVAINSILDTLDSQRIDVPKHRLREILGHKPLEVTVGAALGLLLGALLNYTHLDGFFDAVTTPVSLIVTYVTAAVALLLIVGGVLGGSYYLRKYHHVTLVKRAVKQISWSAIALGILGILLSFLQYQKITVCQWALWSGVYLVLIIGVKLTFYLVYRHRIPAAIGEQAATVSKQQWLEGPNKKERAKRAKAKKRK